MTARNGERSIALWPSSVGILTCCPQRHFIASWDDKRLSDDQMIGMQLRRRAVAPDTIEAASGIALVRASDEARARGVRFSRCVMSEPSEPIEL